MGNPLKAEESTMFEIFEREGWPPERRCTHILRWIEDRGRVARGGMSDRDYGAYRLE